MRPRAAGPAQHHCQDFVMPFRFVYRSLGPFAVLLCASGVAAADYPADSGWNIFWGAFVDELVGAPSAAALKPLARFEEAGIAFDYPAVLRVNHDAEDKQWRLWRGDFELEVRTGTYDADHAQTLMSMMGSVLHGGDEPAAPPEPAPMLRLCGRDVAGLRLRLTFVGDPHEFLAYDLPLANGESRLFLFDDILRDGKPSAAREATLDAWRGSLRCTAS
jgi:hypothetical protein